MREWHRPRIQALIEAGVDLLALETIPCQEEAEMLCDLLREFPNMKAWLSFSCKVSIRTKQLRQINFQHICKVIGIRDFHTILISLRF